MVVGPEEVCCCMPERWKDSLEDDRLGVHYTLAAGEWHVQNKSAFSDVRKGTYDAYFTEKSEIALLIRYALARYDR